MSSKYSIGASAGVVEGHRLVERVDWRDGSARTYLQCVVCGAIGEGAGAFRAAGCDGEEDGDARDRV